MKSTKFTTKLPNGRLKVNKTAIIAHLAKLNAAKRKALELGAIAVSQREIEAEARDLVRNNADSVINTSEE